MSWWEVLAVVVQVILLLLALMMYFRSAHVHMLPAEPHIVYNMTDSMDSPVNNYSLLVAREVADNFGLSIPGTEVDWDPATPLLLLCDQTGSVQDGYGIKLRPI
jgi:hypothetical protein